MELEWEEREWLKEQLLRIARQGESPDTKQVARALAAVVRRGDDILDWLIEGLLEWPALVQRLEMEREERRREQFDRWAEEDLEEQLDAVFGGAA
ncbi:MAG: hypothetical protein J7M26_03100 [Armatimonadetes bacterium]|nr:hypothetical protein [Armatimonadota bacterium]